MIVVIATRNGGKLAEFELTLTPPAGVGFSPLSDHDAPEVEETADDFAGNARLKAGSAALATGRWALGDDSGLVVDALGGAPGVLSARYAGAHGDAAAHRAKLLREMGHLSGGERAASYVCALALARPDGAIAAEFGGRCNGLIADAPRGPDGFGYDQLFVIREYHRTFAELGPRVKRRISHRARASGAALRFLAALAAGGVEDSGGG